MKQKTIVIRDFWCVRISAIIWNEMSSLSGTSFISNRLSRVSFVPNNNLWKSSWNVILKKNPDTSGHGKVDENIQLKRWWCSSFIVVEKIHQKKVACLYKYVAKYLRLSTCTTNLCKNWFMLKIIYEKRHLGK